MKYIIIKLCKYLLEKNWCMKICYAIVWSSSIFVWCSIIIILLYAIGIDVDNIL